MSKSPTPSLPLILFLAGSLLAALVLYLLWPSQSDVAEEPPRPLSLASDFVWSGDLDALAERNAIRFLVAYNKMFYFLDGATQRGVAYEMGSRFVEKLNKKYPKRQRKIHAVFIPVSRDQLIPALLEGRGDIAAANLTITPERLQQVDFSDPFIEGVEELAVTGPAGPELSSVEDLSGQTIHVRKSSSYYASLQRLNGHFSKEGKAPIKLELASPLFEDADLLEMVNAGMIPTAVVDSHKAAFWAEIFPDIQVHKDIAVNTGGAIGWAFRKGSPQLKAAVNSFVVENKKGTLYGNILLQRYLKQNQWVRKNLNTKGRKKFQAMVGLFKKYAEQYHFDYLKIAALAYQESRLDQSKRSPTGAIGVMQLLPSTAKDPNVGIPDITKVENNIHAGNKYLRFLYDRYFAAEPMNELNKMLFTFAAYNAGPAKVQQLRTEAQKMGLDPNRWFHNVAVAAAKRIGRETVQYVANIYKYYTAYKLVEEHRARKQEAKN